MREGRSEQARQLGRRKTVAVSLGEVSWLSLKPKCPHSLALVFDAMGAPLRPARGSSMRKDELDRFGVKNDWLPKPPGSMHISRWHQQNGN